MGNPPDDDDGDDDENDDHDINDAEKTKKLHKNRTKRSETIQKQPKRVPKTIRKCCEIGPKIAQIAKQKVAFIFSAGGSLVVTVPLAPFPNPSKNLQTAE